MASSTGPSTSPGHRGIRGLGEHTRQGAQDNYAATVSHSPTGWVSSTGIGETQSVDRATACACSEPEQNATELIAPDRPAMVEIP